MTRAFAVPALLALAACDAPTLPERDGFYDFTSESDVVFHWPLGATVRLYAVPAADAELDAVLRRAVATAVRDWNAAATFGEYRLAAVSDVSQAHAVVRWSSSALPVVVPRDTATCNPDASIAHTVFCWVTDSAPMRLIALAQPDGTPTPVRAVVTVLDVAPVDTARALRYFVHEIGHVLGIWGHSTDSDDLMFTAPVTDSLSAADRATVQALYRTDSEAVMAGAAD